MTIINNSWIKERIAKTYHPNCLITHPAVIIDKSRKLLISKSNSAYNNLGYIFFSLEGSPPKGCAIYSPEHHYIIIIDAWGKKKTTYEDKYYEEEELK